MSETVDSVAQDFLKHLVTRGMKIKAPFHVETDDEGNIKLLPYGIWRVPIIHNQEHVEIKYKWNYGFWGCYLRRRPISSCME